MCRGGGGGGSDVMTNFPLILVSKDGEKTELKQNKRASRTLAPFLLKLIKSDTEHIVMHRDTISRVSTL